MQEFPTPMHIDSLKDVLTLARRTNDYDLWLRTAKDLILYTPPFDRKARAETDAILAQSLVIIPECQSFTLEQRASICEIAAYIPRWQLINSFNENKKTTGTLFSVLASIPSSHASLTKILARIEGYSHPELLHMLDATIPKSGPQALAYRRAVDLFRTTRPLALEEDLENIPSTRAPFRRLLWFWGKSSKQILRIRSLSLQQLFDLQVEAELLPKKLTKPVRSALAKSFFRRNLPSWRLQEQQEMVLIIARQIGPKMLLKESRSAGTAFNLQDLALWLIGNPLAHQFLRILAKRTDILSIDTYKEICKLENQHEQSISQRSRLASVHFFCGQLDSATAYIGQWQDVAMPERKPDDISAPIELQTAQKWLARNRETQKVPENRAGAQADNHNGIGIPRWNQILLNSETKRLAYGMYTKQLSSENTTLSENGALRIALEITSIFRDSLESTKLRIANSLQSQGFENLALELLGGNEDGPPSTALKFGRLLDKYGSPEKRLTIWRSLLEHHRSPAFLLSFAAALIDNLCFDEADTIITEMLEKSENKPTIYRNQILLLSRRGELDAAHKLAIDLLKQFPESKILEGDLYRCSIETGKIETPPFMETEVERDNINLLRALSDHHLAKGEVDAAREVREKIAEATEHINDYHRQLNAIFAAGEFEEASEFCYRMKQRFPGATAFWKKAGQVCERRRDYEGMLYNFTEMLALAPEDNAARSAVGRALIYLGRSDETLSWLRICDDEQDESVWTSTLRGFFHARHGNDGMAKDALNDVYDRCANVMGAYKSGIEENLSKTYLLNGEYKCHPRKVATHVHHHFCDWLHALEQGSTALIGNSPSLLNQEHGAEIDEFDTVIRLNDFVIEGYERDLGTKTDYWYSSANRQASPHRPSVMQAKTILMQPDARQFPDIAVFTKGRLGFGLDPANTGYLAPCVKMMSEHLSYPFPSTGFRMIQILEFLVQQPFTAYGFDFFSSGEMHYFDTGETHLQVGEVHAIDFERDLVEQLIVPHGRHAKFI